MALVASSSVAVPSAPQVDRRAARSTRVPWEIWCGALAVTSVSIGLEWDISWHRSIGRDTFWTPAHMLIYLCGVLSAIVCAYLVLFTTFGKSSEMRANAVSVFGFRAPLGCFIATWGGLAMLVSAPFDNWWHAAYGLDVQLISPPHCLLFLGINLIEFGFLLLIAGAMNRAVAAGASNLRTLQALFLYTGGLLVFLEMFIITQLIDTSILHNATPYKYVALVAPPLLAFVAQSSARRWAAVIVALMYTVIGIAAILILPLFPATPKLGPVFTPITHFIPPTFPILILVPALALSLLWQFTNKVKPLPRAMASGIVFMASLLAVEWPFASFLVSPAARNRFFGTMYRGYQTLPSDRLQHFSFVQHGWTLWHGLLIATIYAVVASWAGLRMGDWLRSVQR